MADASAPKGARAPLPGEIFRNPALARSLREVASGGKRAFYEGRIGRAIAELVQEHGGAMSPADLADHKESTFDEPISVPFRGVDVYEHGPNGSGVAALIALRILEAMHPFPSSLGHNSAPYLHALIEALRLAFADARWYVSDPAVSPTPMEQLLSAETRSAYARRAREEHEQRVPMEQLLSCRVRETMSTRVSLTRRRRRWMCAAAPPPSAATR